MTEKTLEYYIDHPDELTDAEVERLEGAGDAKVAETLGDYPPKPSEVSAEAELSVEKTEAEAEVKAEAVEPDGVESRDGKHVIPYWRLADAEAKARAKEIHNKQLEAKLAEYEAAAKTPDVPDLAEITEEDLQQFEGVFPAIGKAVKASHSKIRELEGVVEALTSERERERQEKIDEIVRNADEARDANPKLSWLYQHDKAGYDRAADIDMMLRANPEWQGKTFAERFQKVVDAYEVLHGEIPVPNKTLKQQVETPKPISRPNVPVSMSTIPGGAAPPVDEASAMSLKTGEELVNMFMSMSPEQIERALRRL